MRHNNSENRFYNRDSERKTITEKVRENKSQGHIIFLAGTTGVGKSGLAQKLLQDELSDYKSVVLRIGKSSIGTIENLSYFNALYRGLIEVAQKRKDYGLKTAEQYGRRNILNWLHIVIEAVKSYFHIDPDRRLAEPAEEYSISRKKEYIVSVLKNGPFIVNIQNIQNIDTQSAELFQSIIEKVPTVSWVMEYTLPDQGVDSQFYSFINEWQSAGCDCSFYEIKQLDFDLAFCLAPPEVQNPIQRKQLETRYEKAHGNLLTIMVVPDNLDTEDDYIKSKLESLDQDEKYVVYILYLNEAPISKSILLSILTKEDEQGRQISFSYSKSEALLQKLEEDNVIAEQGRNYSVKHDSLTAVLSQIPANPALFLAYRVLERHYQEKMGQEKWSREDCINHLFSLYVRFHDENLIHLFPKLWDLILSAKYPKDIVEKIERYRQQLLDGGTDLSMIYPVSRFLTELCIKLQYPEAAQESLDIIYNVRPSQYLVGLQGAICALRSTPENWDRVNSLIANAEEGSRLKISLCLCRLRMMMRSCGSNRPKKYAEELLACSAYRNTPEYGFLLHNYAEFSESPFEALDYYRQALRIFEKYGLVNMQAEVNISMSMSYGYAGQLKNARRAIRKAEKLAPGYISETVLLNNNAVIDILDGKVSPSVLNKLADAVLMDTNPYEVLIIKSNWLAGLTLCQHMEQAADLACEIERSNYETYQYEDFLHIVYQNLFFFYSQVEDNEKISIYRKKLVDLSARDGISQGTQKLIQMMLQKKHVANIFYTQFPFRVDFLGFWGLEISRDLESFQ